MSSSTEARHRRQWLLSGLIVTAVGGFIGSVLDLLVDWPSPGMGLLVGVIAIPAVLVSSRSPRWNPAAPAVLTHVIVVSGLVVTVAAVYVVTVVGLSGVPEDHERTILGLSMAAAAVVALLISPVRTRLTEWANQQVYGELHSPDDALRTFGTRMSRSVPMDELLLQLVETLKKTMDLSRAEVWTGSDGRLTLAASVPDRAEAPLVLGDRELAVAARAHAQGNSWLEMWIPQILQGREDDLLRAVSVAHLGELLGMIVLTRSRPAQPFTEDEDEALVELARQLGLALHNVSLDSALQASLDELAARNRDLIASRARIVAAADESRRAIERNLHDGAQQHLVALAVKTGLVKTIMASDSDQALILLDELREDVQATLTELRELAHGIYPPLLMERGLGEALVTVANRSVLPAEVAANGIGRYPSDLEAAVYFCCVEAVQNAGKYAGDSATLTISVEEDDCALSFRVRDDGSGFDPDLVGSGHGFVNMADRLGAFGGSLTVESEPGRGSVVSGRIPLDRPTGEPG